MTEERAPASIEVREQPAIEEPVRLGKTREEREPTQEEEVGKQSVIEQPFRLVQRFFEEMWLLAGGGHPGGSGVRPPEDYLENLFEVYGPEDLYTSRGLRDRSVPQQALVGTLQEVSVQVTAEVVRLADNRPELIAFLRNSLAPTLERFQREGIAVQENHVDLLTQALLRAGIAPTRCSESARRFTAAVRQYLGGQKPRGTGLMITWAALPAFLAQAREAPVCTAWSAFYYHEILTHYFHSSEDELQPIDYIRIRLAANNCSNLVDEYRRLLSQPAEVERAIAVRHRLKLISSATVRRAIQVPDQENASALALLTDYFDRGPADPLWPALLDDMLSSSTAWLVEGWTYWHLGIVEAATAMARLALEARREEAPSSLFNGGISIHRLIQARQVEPEVGHRARGILNGLGFWWALRTPRTDNPIADLRRAMIDSTGLSCAINFFAAISEIAPWPPEQLDNLKRLAGLLLALLPILPERRNDYFQLQSSLDDLKIKATQAELTAEWGAGATQHLDAVLRHLLAGAGVSVEWPEDPLTSTVRISRAMFFVIGPQEEAERVLDEVILRLRQVEENTWRPMEVLREQYGEMAGEPDLDPERPGLGPLVPSELMTPAQWRDVALDASTSDVPFPQLLRVPGEMDWLLER